MSNLSQKEYDLTESNIDAVQNLSKTSNCIDAYSQVNTGEIISNQQKAQSSLWKYNILY